MRRVCDEWSRRWRQRLERRQRVSKGAISVDQPANLIPLLLGWEADMAALPLSL